MRTDSRDLEAKGVIGFPDRLNENLGREKCWKSVVGGYRVLDER